MLIFLIFKKKKVCTMLTMLPGQGERTDELVVLIAGVVSEGRKPNVFLAFTCLGKASKKNVFFWRSLPNLFTHPPQGFC